MKVATLLFISIVFSCSYYSMTGSIPSHIKSVSIPEFLNETAEYGIEQRITNLIIEKFNENGVLKVVDKENSDSVLKGSISKIDERPFTYNKDEVISEFRYKILIKLDWYDVSKDKSIISKTYSAFGSYGVSGDISNDGIDNDNDGKIDENDNDEFGEPRIYASNVAATKIAEDIINDIMSTW